MSSALPLCGPAALAAAAPAVLPAALLGVPGAPPVPPMPAALAAAFVIEDSDQEDLDDDFYREGSFGADEAELQLRHRALVRRDVTVGPPSSQAILALPDQQKMFASGREYRYECGVLHWLSGPSADHDEAVHQAANHMETPNVWPPVLVWATGRRWLWPAEQTAPAASELVPMLEVVSMQDKKTFHAPEALLLYLPAPGRVRPGDVWAIAYPYSIYHGKGYMEVVPGEHVLVVEHSFPFAYVNRILPPPTEIAESAGPPPPIEIAESAVFAESAGRQLPAEIAEPAERPMEGWIHTAAFGEFLGSA